MLKSTRIKLFLPIVVLVLFLVSVVTVVATVPYGAGSIWLRARYNCRQMGGVINLPWENFTGTIYNSLTRLISGQYSSAPLCWCGLKPIYGYNFNDCRQHINYQLLGFGLILSTLVIFYFWKKQPPIKSC